uniref:MFS domain-containing protein n=1 Tax=Rhabditophanes sp. KR3021 TaxID=114890 RepID=A0AC35U594_9BILA
MAVSEDLCDPDSVLNKLGLWNLQQLTISATCAFIWGLTTFPMLIPSYVQDSATCDDCNPRLANASTLRKDFNLIDADLQWYSITFYLGCMLGGVTLSYLADIYGRKRISLPCLFIVGISGLATAWAPSYWFILVCRVIQGICYPAAGCCMWILALESVSFKKHAIVGLIFNLSWTLGYCIIPLTAFLVPSWNYLTIILSAPLAIIAVLATFLLPESFHFMLKSRNKKGLKKFIGDKANVNIDEMVECYSPDGDEGIHISRSYLYIKNNKKYLVYGFVTSFIWSTQFLLYLTFSISSSSLSGNPYWNFAFTGLAELPSVLIGPFIMNRFHRKKPMIVSAFIVCILCFSLIFIPQTKTTLYLVFWMSCKLLLAFTYVCLYVYFPEIFPTQIRNTSIGLCQTLANVGGVLNTLLGTWIPNKTTLMILFTTISFINGILLFTLPETTEDNTEIEHNEEILEESTEN